MQINQAFWRHKPCKMCVFAYFFEEKVTSHPQKVLSSSTANLSFQLRYAGLDLIELFIVEAEEGLQPAALLQVPQSLTVLPLVMDFTVLRAIKIFFVLP